MNNDKIILVVDDNEMDLELAKNAILKIDAEVKIDTARDGIEALEYLEHRGKFASRSAYKPKLILLDIKMPRMNGLELLGQIHTNDKLKTIPVVMFTSSQEPNDVEKSYQMGANAYLVKPVDYVKFIDVVKCAVSFWVSLNVFSPT